MTIGLLLTTLLILGGCQEPMSQSSFTNDQKSLPEPFEISTTPPTNESITISWNASKNATGYKVLSKKKEEANFQTVATLSNQTSYTVTNLLYGVEYQIKISAFNNYGRTESEAISLILSPEPPVINFMGVTGTTGSVGQPMEVVPNLLDENGSPVTNCSVLPLLPNGLSINDETCVISGTPTGISNLRSYVVTAKNSVGTGSTSVALSVIPSPPEISFEGSTSTSGHAGTYMSVTPNSLITNGAAITECSVYPNLPTGLIIDNTTCEISGTPSVSLSLTKFTIIATNSAGSDASDVSISIEPSAPILDFTGAMGTLGLHSSPMSVSPTTLVDNGSPILNCSINPNLPNGLTIHPTTCVISGTPLEIKSSSTFTITASNAIGDSSSNVDLTINPSSPVISYSGSVGTNGSFVLSMTVNPTTLNSNGASIINCSISPDLPAGLEINNLTCGITGTPTETLSSTIFTVTVTNSAGSGTGEVTLEVLPSSPIISYNGASETSGAVGSLFSLGPTTLNSRGADIINCDASPSLPDGLIINDSTCVISGVPSETLEESSFAITATNSAGSTTTTVSLEVVPSAPIISYEGSTGTQGKVGSPMSVTPTTLNNRGASLESCSISPDLPEGLSINNLCTISGIPWGVSSEITYTVTATNSAGTESTSVTLSVSSSAPIISYSGTTGTSGKVKEAMNVVPMTLINGGSLITNCTSSPVLPEGLSINSSTCIISGAPTALLNTTTFTITATNSAGSSTTSLSLSVFPNTPSLSYSNATGTLGTYGVGISISPTIIDDRGAVITKCEIVPTLPTGMSIDNNTCVISGTPVEILSETTFTVTATNSAGTGGGTVQLSVLANVPVISFAGSIGTTGFVGESMSIIPTTLDEMGAEVTSCTTSPQLPTGLSIDSSTCVISGIPLVTLSESNFSVTATNSAGSSSENVSLTINASAPIISFDSSSGTNGAVGVMMSVTPSTLNNQGADITVCTISPLLPDGLSINEKTCEISGYPTEVLNTTSYEVTATNSAGNGAAYVTLSVSASVPTLSYTGVSGAGVYNSSFTMAPSILNLNGAIIESCIIGPDLPSGLSINNSTCIISGTPQALSPETTYTVTVQNSAGSATATLSLSVGGGSLSFTEDGNAQTIALHLPSGTAGDQCSTLSFSSNSLVTTSVSGVHPDCEASILPNLNQNGSGTLTLSFNDIPSPSSTLDFSITTVDDAPVVSNVSGSLTEDTQGLVTLSYSDLENHSATSCTLSSLSNLSGTCSCTSGTCVASVTGTSNYNGSASFSYAVTANGLTSSAATASVTISAVDDAPVASNVSGSLTEDTQGLVTLSYSDPENHSATSCTLSSLSNLSGTCSCTSGTCVASVTGTSNYNGSASFSYTVTANGLTSSASTASVTISAVDDAPVVSNVSGSLTEDTQGLVTLSYSDLESHPATTCALTFPSLSSLTGTCTCTLGVCQASVTGSSNFSGSASFTYTVTANGLVSNSATASVTVSPVNDAPVLSSVSGQTTNEDTVATVTLSVTDVDSSINCSSFISASSSDTSLVPNVSITISGTAPGCTLNLTPALNLSGTSNIIITASDGSLSDTESFVLTVNAVNDAPVIASIGTQTTNEDTSKLVNFSITDVDSSLDCISSISVTSSSPVSSVTKGGTAPNCTLNVVPIANLSGSSSISLTVSDESLTASQSFTFTVTTVDDAPVASNVSATISEDVATLVTLSYSDVDGDQALSCALSSLSNLSGSCSCSTGTCQANVTGTSNFNGAASFSYTVTANGAVSNSASASITISAVNDAPTLGSISNQTTTVGNAVSFSITPSDIETSLSCDTSISVTSSDTNVLALASITKSGTFPSCSLSLNPSGVGSSTVTVTITDGSLTASRSFTLTVESSFIKLKKISSWGNRTCAINNAGTLKCWGLDSLSYSSSAVSVSGINSEVISVDIGGTHTCALTTAGGVKCWGRNLNGQLGNNSTTQSSTPIDVSGLTSGVAAIAVGGYHSCAVMNSGELKCWGRNSMGELGDGSFTQRLIPTTVSGLSSGVVAVEAGLNHTCALLSSGGMKCWGMAEYGQLGNNSQNPYRQNAPVDVIGLSSGVKAISSGGNHTCALLSNGGVKCWGYNLYGQVGNGTTTTYVLTPSDVSGSSSGGAFVSAGNDHTCVTTSSGGARCWGANYHSSYPSSSYVGKIGIGSNLITTFTTSQSVSLVTSGIGEISTGGMVSCVLLNSGASQCWGTNSEGDLGNNNSGHAVTSATNVVNFP